MKRKEIIFHHFPSTSRGKFVFCLSLSLSNLELCLILACRASLGDFLSNRLDLKLTWKMMNKSQQGWKLKQKLIFRGKVPKPWFSHRRCTKAFLSSESASHHVGWPVGSRFTWFAASAERKCIFKVENLMNYEVFGFFSIFSFSQFWMVLE